MTEAEPIPAVETTEAPEPDAEAAAVPRTDGRRVLAALFWLLASLSIMVGGVTVWAHQTLLTSSGWSGVVADVTSDPEVIDAASLVVVERLSDSLGARETVASILPGQLDIVAGALAGTLESQVAKGVAEVASTDAFQDVLVKVNEAAHEAAMKAIRGGDSEALTSEEGVITLNVFPLVEAVLVTLQDNGIIGADREIPDLAGYEPSPVTVRVLETVLGRDLPDDVGVITLVESENLALVQDAIRWFDLITIVMILLAILFVALALWLSERRIRMALWLSGGAIAALAVSRVFARLIFDRVTVRLEDAEASVIVTSFVDAALDSLLWFTFVLMAVALIVAVLSMWWERREKGERPSEETPPRTLGHWVREHMMAILAVGVAVIGFLALWNVGGPDVALVTAAAIGLLVIAVRVLAGDDEESTPEAGST